MKIGEIRGLREEGFIIQTPIGVRHVTLRCTIEGNVVVEEVMDSHISLRPLQANQIIQETKSDDNVSQIAAAADHLKMLRHRKSS